jgi:hypothetical protein
MELVGIVVAVIVATFLLTVIFGAPYVPSRRRDLNEVFKKLYKLSANDVLVDVGSGDGKVLKAASISGARRAVGFELNPFLVLISILNCRRYKNTKVICGNFLKCDLPADTTVVYIFGVEHLMEKVKQKILKLSKKTRRKIFLISYGFALDSQEPIKRHGAFYLYEIG